MAWTSISPIGSLSVKANRTTMNGNTTYIETTMGNTVAGTVTAGTKDHFWNVSSNLDGHHRFVRSPKFEAPAGTAANPVVGTGMNGVQYIRLVNSDVGRVECFYRNADAAVGNYPGIYQTSPSFQAGTAAVTSSYSSLGDAIPKNVYGEIFMFVDDNVAGSLRVQTGIFKSSSGTIQTAAVKLRSFNGDDIENLQFDSTGLQLQVKSVDGPSTNWKFRITYRAI